MCGGGGSPAPVDTYVGNGTKKGGKLSPDYGHDPAPQDPIGGDTPSPTNRMARGGNTQSGLKM